MPQINYCPSCGTKLDKDYTLCPQCGEDIKALDSNKGTAGTKRQESKHSKPDDYRLPGSETFLWGLLGFLAPLIGLIMYLVWKNEKPQIAGALGTGAMISVVIALLMLMFFATAAGAQMTAVL